MWEGFLLSARLLIADSCRASRNARPGTSRAAPQDGPEIFPPLHEFPQPVRIFRPPSRPVVLSQMSRAAGMIFSGQVTAIARRHASGGNAIETVDVTFRVERAIRGVKKGQILTVAQWAGVWSRGERYRVGQRLLLFLYPPSRLGLTSSVGGALGRFTVDIAGWVLLSEQHLSAFATDPVLRGKSRVAFNDFAQNVRRVSGEE